MKHLIFWLFAASLLFSSCYTTTYYLVRHAERANSSDTTSLSGAGFTRAGILRDSLLDKGIDSIFISNTKRAEQTAEPLATALSEPYRIYSRDTIPGLITALLKIQNKQVLVVGHSETTPPVVFGLCGETVSIGSSEFNKLFIVTIRKRCSKTTRTLVETTYGP